MQARYGARTDTLSVKIEEQLLSIQRETFQRRPRLLALGSLPLAMASAAASPSQVLYVNNLNDKLHVENVLKRQLYRLFSQYGKIAEVVAFKGLKGRGQAWIVFNDVNAATSALRSKQGFNFYDKPLRIAFAKTKPDSVLLAEKVAQGKSAAAAESSSNKKRKAKDVDGGEKPPSKK